MAAVAVFVASRCRRRARSPRRRRCRGTARRRRVSRSFRRDPTAPARSTRSPRPRPRAGLQFVILTDHGDGTRAPDPPAYRHGVLCIDAVEISTVDGHLVALNLAAAVAVSAGGRGARRHRRHPSARRLGGGRASGLADGRTSAGGAAGARRRHRVAERRLGVAERHAQQRSAAHGTPIARSWRPKRSRRCSAAARASRAGTTVQRARPVVGLAAVDAHARIGPMMRRTHGAQRQPALQFPSYASAVSHGRRRPWRSRRPLARARRQTDAQAILDATRAGRSFSDRARVRRAVPSLEFSVATRSTARIAMGSSCRRPA